jgi:K+-transporting ATPase KdpF subunit
VAGAPFEFSSGNKPMNVFYLVAAVIAVALTGYLCVALLKPEWFE